MIFPALVLVWFEMEAGEDEADNNDSKGPIPRTVYEYADAATIHGIYYIFESGRLIFERIFWVIIVILALVFAISLSISAYDNWKANPVLTSVGTTGYPIEKVAFPSITICPQGAANGIIEAALFKQFERYLAEENKNTFQLSQEELQNEAKEFLSLIYPGANQGPTQMIRMLGSPAMTPDKSLEAEAVLNPEDKHLCEPNEKNDSNLKCPDGFVYTISANDRTRSCWHFEGPSNKRNYEDARNSCKGLLTATDYAMFQIQIKQDWDVLWKIIATGFEYSNKYFLEI